MNFAVRPQGCAEREARLLRKYQNPAGGVRRQAQGAGLAWAADNVADAMHWQLQAVCSHPVSCNYRMKGFEGKNPV
jgi:hypothetical protein